MKALVVDDSQVSRTLLERTLQKWGYEALCAANGAQAWDLLRADDTISLIITDWFMPEMDGPQLCRLARQLKRERYLPIILMTSHEEKERLAEGLNAGADAFLRKPLSPAELQAEIRVMERILRLEDHLAAQLHNVELAHDRLKRDLEAAAAVQRSLLPASPPDVAGVEFGWIYEACEMVAGDMFNVSRLDQDLLGVYVLDVSGHGVQAALLSFSLSRVLTPYEQQGGILKRLQGQPPGYQVASPAEVAEELNRRFPVLDQSGQFFTFLYGILDPLACSFRYVSAGHLPPVHVSGGRALVAEKKGGLPIGILPDESYDEGVLEVSPGDQIFLCTDGAYEARNSQDEMLGKDRLLGILSANGDKSVSESIRLLRRRIEEFRDGRPADDDVTIVGLGLA